LNDAHGVIGRLLARGMLAGIAAACLAFVFARLVGEPQIAHAIAFEAHQQALAGLPPETESVSRRIQSTFGLFVALLMSGCAYGGLFAIAFATFHKRFTRLNARNLSFALALAGFIVFALIPALKYPPNPPAVGNPETIGPRTAAYFTMLVVSFAAAMIGFLVFRRGQQRYGSWNAGVAGSSLFLLAMVGLSALLPDYTEVPAGFPAVTLWRFREAALGLQLVLWLPLGLVFGALAERMLLQSDTRH